MKDNVIYRFLVAFVLTLSVVLLGSSSAWAVPNSSGHISNNSTSLNSISRSDRMAYVMTPTPDPTENPYGSYNETDTEFGNWADNWPSFLALLVFATASCVFIALFFINMAKEALNLL